MEVLTDIVENRLSKRYIALKKLEYHIEESVYYRSFSEDINLDKRQLVYSFNDENGKVNIK
jgi:hypothetical protein